MANMKSVAALLRDDITTISVGLDDSGKEYTFKAVRKLAKDVALGDQVLVKARGRIKIATVVEVHAEPQIDPDSNINYAWAFARVPDEVLSLLEDEDEKLVRKLESHRRQQVRDHALTALGISDTRAFLADLSTDATQ